MNDKALVLYKTKQRKKKNPSCKGGVFCKSPFALTGGFSLFLAFDAGLFVMLALTYFLENAAAGALPLKPFERTFQGLIFADSHLGHCYPSPRSIQWPADSHKTINKTISDYTAKAKQSQLFSENVHPRANEGGNDTV